MYCFGLMEISYLSDLFSKAKKKIIKNDGLQSGDSDVSTKSRKVLGYSPTSYEPQCIGNIWVILLFLGFVYVKSNSKIFP